MEYDGNMHLKQVSRLKFWNSSFSDLYKKWAFSIENASCKECPRNGLNRELIISVNRFRVNGRIKPVNSVLARGLRDIQTYSILPPKPGPGSGIMVGQLTTNSSRVTQSGRASWSWMCYPYQTITHFILIYWSEMFCRVAILDRCVLCFTPADCYSWDQPRYRCSAWKWFFQLRMTSMIRLWNEKSDGLKFWSTLHYNW